MWNLRRRRRAWSGWGMDVMDDDDDEEEEEDSCMSSSDRGGGGGIFILDVWRV